MILYPNAFDKWDNGFPIAPEQRERLFQNVKDALEFKGLKMLIE